MAAIRWTRSEVPLSAAATFRLLMCLFAADHFSGNRPKNFDVRFTPDSEHSASRVERLLMTLALGVWAFGGHIDNLDFGCF